MSTTNHMRLYIATGQPKTPATFATRQEILKVLPRGERHAVALLHQHMAEGVSLAELHRVHGLSPTAVRRLSRSFRFGPLTLTGYAAVVSHLITLAGEFEREVYGFYESRGDRFALWARLGEPSFCPALNRKRTFHTHPAANPPDFDPRTHGLPSYDFSDYDFISFLTRGRSQETTIASCQGALRARKTDPTLPCQSARIIKALEAIVIYGNWEEVTALLHITFDASMSPQAVNAVKKPGSRDRDLLFKMALPYIIQKLLTGNPYDQRANLSAHGIELEEYSPSLEHQHFPATPQTLQIQTAVSYFQANPIRWLQAALGNPNITLYHSISE